MSEPATSSLAALSRFFVGDGTFDQTLNRVTDLTVEAVPAADLAGITLLLEGRPRTAFFTDEASPEIDQAQYDAGDEPCLAAFDEQRSIMDNAAARGGPARANGRR